MRSVIVRTYLCMWEAREILWAVQCVFDVVILARVAVSTEYSVELECSVGVRELTSSIFYARCVLLGYVRSALCLESRMRLWSRVL